MNSIEGGSKEKHENKKGSPFIIERYEEGNLPRLESLIRDFLRENEDEDDQLVGGRLLEEIRESTKDSSVDSNSRMFFLVLKDREGRILGITNGLLGQEEGQSYHTLAFDKSKSIGSKLFQAKCDFFFETGMKTIAAVPESEGGKRICEKFGFKEKKRATEIPWAGEEYSLEKEEYQTPEARIGRFLDEGSFREFVSSVEPPETDWAVIGGEGMIDGRKVFNLAADHNNRGGSLSEKDCEMVCEMIKEAERRNIPLISLLHSSGARMEDLSRSMDGYAKIFAARINAQIPQISVILGPCPGGPAYEACLTDVRIMTGEGRIYLTTPEIVKKARGPAEVGVEEKLGNKETQILSGVIDLGVEDEKIALEEVKKLLLLSPEELSAKFEKFSEKRKMAEPDINIDAVISELESSQATPDSPERENPASEQIANLPENKTYDMKEIIKEIADNKGFVEMQEEVGKGTIIGFIRLDNKLVGIVASQPKEMAGAITAEGAVKVATFVRYCDGQNIAVVTLQDTQAFMPGKTEEAKGILWKGAEVLKSYIESEIPKLTLILRKGSGAGYIALGSKHLGTRWVGAWPKAKIMPMKEDFALPIIYRREIERREKEGTADKFLQTAAEKYRNDSLASHALGKSVDEIVPPSQTRKVLIERLREVVK